MLKIDPDKTPTRDLHQFLLGIVGPRPIAWVSSIDRQGRRNLAPYSFYNAFSSNPPVLVFSSNRRVLDNTTKDTLANVQAVPEVVIHAVNHELVRKMAITSVQFDADTDEFEQAGLTAVPSDLVRPWRIAESPAAMECKVSKVLPLGEHGGAGNLIFCEVLRIHLREEVVDEKGRINPHKMDLMGRLGRAYYVRASGDAIHTIVQPVTQMVIGYQALPEHLRNSTILSANNLGQLAGLYQIPSAEACRKLLKTDNRLQEILQSENKIEALHHYIREVLENDKEREHAGCLAWIPEYW